MQKTKRPLSFLLAVVMIASMFAAVPFTASAIDVWDGIIPASAPSGYDETADPITLDTVDEFVWFFNRVGNGTNFSGKTVVLTTDIVLGGHEFGSVWPTAGNTFNGTFDGQNHTVSNFTFTSATQPYRWSLFRNVKNATIKNLQLDNVEISGGTGTGHAALVGMTQGSVTIENVHILRGLVSCGSAVGGVVGQNKGTVLTIKGCSNAAEIIANNNNAGGIVGASTNDSNDNTAITVENCVNTGYITATKGYASGIYGVIEPSTAQPTVVFKDCTNGGVLSAPNENTDDICAKAVGSVTVESTASNAVIAKIDAIGTVEYTDACKAKIDDARAAYDALTDTQKTLVTNYTTLTDAETTYANLKAAAEAAFTITWLNWNGSLLKTDTGIAAGATPTYDGETPEKAADEENAYVFSGWTDGEHTYGLGDTLPEVTGDATYTATFRIAGPEDLTYNSLTTYTDYLNAGDQWYNKYGLSNATGQYDYRSNAAYYLSEDGSTIKIDVTVNGETTTEYHNRESDPLYFDYLQTFPAFGEALPTSPDGLADGTKWFDKAGLIDALKELMGEDYAYLYIYEDSDYYLSVDGTILRRTYAFSDYYTVNSDELVVDNPGTLSSYIREAGYDPNEGFSLLPKSPDGLNNGDYWFDAASFAEVVGGQYPSYYLTAKYYLSEDEQTIRMVMVGSPTDYVKSQYAIAFAFLNKVGAGPEETFTLLPKSPDGLSEGDYWFDAAGLAAHYDSDGYLDFNYYLSGDGRTFRMLSHYSMYTYSIDDYSGYIYFSYLYQVGVDPLAGYTQLPTSDAGLNDGDYWFDAAGLAEFVDNDFEDCTFYLSEDGQTILVLYSDGLRQTDPDENGLLHGFLNQVGVDPNAGFEPVVFDVNEIECVGYLFLFDQYLDDYIADYNEIRVSNGQDPFTAEEEAQERAEMREELDDVSFFYNPEDHRIRYVYGPASFTLTEGSEEYKYFSPYIQLAENHAYGAPVWVWAPDHSSATATFTCTACSDEKTVTATPDSEVNTITNAVTTEPTTSAAGVRTYTATVTFGGRTYTDLTTEPIDKLPAQGPQDQVSATITDEITINFLLDLDYRTNPQTITVKHLSPAGEEIETLTYDASKLKKDSKTGLYRLPIPIAPAQGADRYVLSIDGTPIEQGIYSVKDYCESIIAHKDDETYAPYEKLANAMLEYCQAANEYFGYADAFATTEAAQAAVDAAKAIPNTLSASGDIRSKITNAAFMALTKPEFRFYTTGITEAEAAELNDSGKITTNVDGVTAKFYKNGDAILLEVTGIEAKDMDKVITVTVGDLGAITFSGNDFARMMANNASTATLGAALYLYGAAAAACFA